MIYHLKQYLGSLFPNSDCCLCSSHIETYSHYSKLICHFCHTRLPVLLSGCTVCAMPITDAGFKQICGACLKNTPAFSKTVAAFHYEPPVSDFIAQLKYNARRHLVPLLSDYLLQSIKAAYTQQSLPTIIIPVPLHPRKIRQRGFNQSHLIAQYLARHLKISFSDKLAHRIRYTQAQSTLSAVERQKNLNHAFRVEKLSQQSVAIVDDVVTTGTTANELSQQLLEAGAANVDVWSIARAFPQ